MKSVGRINRQCMQCGMFDAFRCIALNGLNKCAEPCSFFKSPKQLAEDEAKAYKRLHDNERTDLLQMYGRKRIMFYSTDKGGLNDQDEDFDRL